LPARVGVLEDLADLQCRAVGEGGERGGGRR
jgi:hypothetical protein